MIRAFKYQIRPTVRQRRLFEHVLGVSCDLYNASLQERREAWRIARKSVSYYDQQKQLTELRAQDADIRRFPADLEREPLRRVDRAFKAFFRRVKAGQKPGYPRFKSKDRYTSFAIALPFFKINGNVVHIAKLGGFKIKLSRPLRGIPKLLNVIRSGKRWRASIVCDIGPAPNKRVVSRAVGIDVGLTALATLSDETVIANPRWTRQHKERIAAAGRALSSKKRGSNNRKRAKEVLRRTHQRAADARTNYLHHVSKQLVANYDLIAHEALNIQAMSRERLAKSIMDAAWGQLLFQLSYKAEEAGRYTVAVNPRGTTQRCSQCGATVAKTLWQRRHDCPQCGLSLGRDENAAINILALGMSAVGVAPAKRVRELSI